MNPTRKEGNKSINSTRQRLDAPIPFLITPQSRRLRKSIGVEHLPRRSKPRWEQPDRLQFQHLKSKKKNPKQQ